MSQGPAESADLGALADLAPELASTFVSVASDIALVIGPDGVIRSVAQGESPLVRQAERLVGQSFVDTVTEDTRGKIRQLLQDVDARGVSRRRDVNIPGAEGGSIPVAFAAIRLGQNGPVLAVGRDLRAIAAIQQRFVEAQQEMERDYWRQRQAESRYRLLFQVATDAVLVLDATTMVIVEANAAAAAMFGRGDPLVGQHATAGIDAASRPAVDELLLTARTTGKPAEIRARLRSAVGAALGGASVLLVDVSATPFRATGEAGSQVQLLVRARRADGHGLDNLPRLAEYVEHTPDAVAITDSSGRVLMANPALLQLCPGVASESQLKGRPLAAVLGDPARRLELVLSETRRQGIVAQARLPVGGGGVAAVEVELSAALLEEGDQECIGVTLRRLTADAAPALSALLPSVDELAAAIHALADQLGRVSLPELMQEATHLAERHLIERAIGSTPGDHRAAAERLGITPESLTLRMIRHGMATGRGVGSSTPPLLN